MCSVSLFCARCHEFDIFQIKRIWIVYATQFHGGNCVEKSDLISINGYVIINLDDDLALRHEW